MRILSLAAKILVLSVLLLYAGDYLSLRFAIPHRDPVSSVVIDVYYAVGLKGNKVEYMTADSETETCSNSLLPQLGHRPCWYVNRHREKWIDM